MLAILFSTYDSLQEAINEAEEIPLGGYMLRAALLGREPSLYEQQLSLSEVLRRTKVFRLLGLEGSSAEGW